MTNSSASNYDRGLAERILHALLFEVLAIGISAPLAAWLTGESAMSMGILTVVVAVMALLWNMTYNWLFDRCQKRFGFDRTVLIRIFHACGFEAGLIIAAVPFIAWWLDTSLWQALILDIGLVLFYLPYAFFFNLAYDKTRQAVLARKQKMQPSSQHIP